MGKIIVKKMRGMNGKAKIALVMVFTLVFSSFMYQGWYKPKPAEAAIAYQTPGAIVYSALRGTSITPAYPAGTAAGNLLVLIVGMKPDTANGGALTPPAGWTAIASLTGAGGYGTTLGIDTGNTNLYTFYRVADGTETGSLSVTIADNNVSWAQIFRFTKTLEYWDVAGATGQDSTTGTGVSIAFGTNPGVTASDFILGAMCAPTDTAAFSAEAFTQTGATFAAATEITEASSSVGNDVGGFIARTTVSSGTGTANPTMTATAGTGTNAMGPGVFIRIREASTPPTTSGLTFDSPVYTTFVGSPFTFHGDLIDNESAVTSCQYCVKNGAECTSTDTWVAGTLTGAAPTWTCTASNVTTYSNATAITSGQSVYIDVRGTSTGGQNANGGTAVFKTMDKTVPTDGTLTITPGADQNQLSWTAATDGTGSGVAGYDVRFLPGTTPPANCSAGTSAYTGTSLTFTHSVTPYTGGYSYRVCALDNVSNPSAGKTGTGLPTWSATISSCGRCHAYPPVDGTARNNPEGAVVGNHEVHNYVCATCHVVPATQTTADNNHRNGSIQMQPGATAISGGYYDKNNNSAYNAGVDDAFVQSNTAATSVCRNVSCHGNGVSPQWGVGTATCMGCHQGTMSEVYNTRKIVETTTGDGTGDFVRLSRHVSNGTSTQIVTDYDCVVCHAEGDAQATAAGTKFLDKTKHRNGSTSTTRMVKLRNVDSITQTYDWNKNAVNEAMRVNLDTFCLNCHDSDGSKGIAVTGPYTSPALSLTPTAAQALSPFNDSDNFQNGRDGLTTRTRVLDVRSQFNQGSGGTGAGYNGNPSQHAVLGARYSTTNASWTATTWTTHTLRNTTQVGAGVMNVTRERAVLHCSDCHLVEANAHGASNAWHLLMNGVAGDFTTDYAMGGVAPTTTASIVCYKCHSSSVYANVASTANTRFSHDREPRVWAANYGDGTATTDGAALGPSCLLCHSGDGYGNIHGSTGTYASNGGTYTRYRFMPGAWMYWQPGTSAGDAAWTDPNGTTGTCYMPGPSTWAGCTQHSGGAAGTQTVNYGRAVKY